MAAVLHYLQFFLGRLFYPFRGHDSRQIIHIPAFNEVPKPNMTLEAVECGPSGSNMLLHHTCLAEDGVGCLPDLRWAPPQSSQQVTEYLLICEDIDLPIPFLVAHHGLFWAIPGSTTTATAADVQVKDASSKSRLTNAGWRFVPNPLGTAYGGPAAPLGHGSHRYVYTIIALDAHLEFDLPEKVTKKDIKRALVGKVIGWAQWTGVFERPWPN
ncbi:Phosphatidylethanolamine-binding protein PEBP [Penicillium hispanicum]|uniref:Phosphatidylethanolamine-binding protein PEBP n=1 Tax=Penicillium hispanicum TaxID=1080232 RepID=UPI00253FD61E|nr:Phosphatidylethanolamine-binding protein PEBP [Penicillium hispanicum]KAJ5592042.1 Phosphatidylethanolamine-binding protein PEBP [Penicillium hispanicum]